MRFHQNMKTPARYEEEEIADTSYSPISAVNSSKLTSLSVCVCGTGEYTTGCVSTENEGVAEAAADKKKGVVGLTLFDLQRLGKVDEISFCGRGGRRFRAIREHFSATIKECYKGMEVDFLSFPEDDVADDPVAYKRAIDNLPKKSGVAVYTPDDTHFDICSYALKKGMHVLVAKPAVLTLEQHRSLASLAEQMNLILMIDLHKRWDPVYIDARYRVARLGDFSYWYSYMSQPVSQLKTFAKWASRASDISYYLNTHHIDVHCWFMEGKAEPLCVSAYAANGVAKQLDGYTNNSSIEDCITLVCQWRNYRSHNVGTAVYTAAWIAPENAEVHSQQRFTCLCHGGEVRVDQAHRGYEATHDRKYSSLNPYYISYATDELGQFSGQHGYGYKAISSWIDVCITKNREDAKQSESSDSSKLYSAFLSSSEELQKYPTIHNTYLVTAILEAGRRSLDNGGQAIPISAKSHSSSQNTL